MKNDILAKFLNWLRFVHVPHNRTAFCSCHETNLFRGPYPIIGLPDVYYIQYDGRCDPSARAMVLSTYTFSYWTAEDSTYYTVDHWKSKGITVGVLQFLRCVVRRRTDNTTSFGLARCAHAVTHASVTLFYRKYGKVPVPVRYRTVPTYQVGRSSLT
jgi:hypothetical protein